jgi:hypothetical protein
MPTLTGRIDRNEGNRHAVPGWERNQAVHDTNLISLLSYNMPIMLLSYIKPILILSYNKSVFSLNHNKSVLSLS